MYLGLGSGHLYALAEPLRGRVQGLPDDERRTGYRSGRTLRHRHGRRARPGRGACTRLRGRGRRVVITDVLDDQGAQLADELGDSARYVHLDVTSEDEWAAAVETAIAAFGPVRVLVNNAGMPIRGAIETATVADWDLVMSVNVRGCFLGIRAVLDSMREAGGGSVVNISSNTGMLGTPNALAYVTSKWAVRGMTKAAAAELGTYGIRVNSIHPSAVATPLLMGGGLTEEAFVERGKDRPAIPRIAEPDEISPAVIYFASDLSRYASGSELLVDGGWAIG
jgi:3alpha(or 20beta)-hydroxysteroid dehydrogenase